MKVWIESPFDNLPSEGFRKQRYWMMAEAFAAAGFDVVYFTSDFNHGTKAHRVLRPGVLRPDVLRPDVLRPEGPRTMTPSGVFTRGASGALAGGASDCSAEGGLAECSLARPGARPFRPKLVLIPTPAYRANVSLKRVWSHGVYARRLVRLAAAQVEAEGAPDVVIAATPTLASAQALQRVAKRCGALFVLDVQDAWPETFARLLPGALKWLAPLLFALWRRRARALYRSADFVSGVSERYRALTGRDDYYRAYHGVSAGGRPTTYALARRDVPHPKPKRLRRLVYLGNLGSGYDLETVIVAVAADPTLTLDVAGQGPRARTLRDLAVRLAASDRVTFHGYLAASEVQKLLARCDVGVIPMRDDSWVGLPYKLGDYLAAGLPVVSSLHGECAELIAREGVGATYDFGSAASLHAALERLTQPGPQAEKRTVLPDSLREDRIYPAYVAAVTARLSARTCR